MFACKSENYTKVILKPHKKKLKHTDKHKFVTISCQQNLKN